MMRIYLQPFMRIFESRSRRRLGIFFVACAFLSLIFNSLDGPVALVLRAISASLGFGGGPFFLGVNLFRFLPDDPILRCRYESIAVLLVAFGPMFFVTCLASIWVE